MLDTTFAALMWTILRKGWISWGMVALRFLDGKKQSNVYTFCLDPTFFRIICWDYLLGSLSKASCLGVPTPYPQWTPASSTAVWIVGGSVQGYFEEIFDKSKGI